MFGKKKLWLRLALIMLIIVMIPAGIFIVMLRRANSVRLPEELKRPPLAAPPAPASALPARRPPVLARLKPSAPNIPVDYSDYIKALNAAGVTSPSVPLYLQLLQRYKDEQINEQLYKLFFMDNDETSQSRGFNFDTITPQQAEWLRREADTLALLHRFCHAEPLPALTFEERMACHERYPYLTWRGMGWNGMIGFGFMDDLAGLLAAQARDRLQQNDPRGAAEAIEDILLLAGHYLNDRANMALFGMISKSLALASDLACECVRHTDFPPAELERIAAAMEALERRYLTPEHACAALTEFYLMLRSGIVAELEKPGWRSSLYGWFTVDPDTGKTTDMPTVGFKFKGHDYQFPEPAAVAIRSLTAVRNRIHSVDALKEFDREFQEAIQAIGDEVAYKDLHRHFLTKDYEGYFSMPANRFLLISDPASQRLSYIRGASIQWDTRFHLFRLAVLWRLHPERPLAPPAAGLGADPHNPWRDPFTHAPLQTDSPTTPTRIWSAGPWLEELPGRRAEQIRRGVGDFILRLKEPQKEPQ